MSLCRIRCIQFQIIFVWFRKWEDHLKMTDVIKGSVMTWFVNDGYIYYI